MLHLALAREGVEIRSSETIAWAMGNLDRSPLGARRAEIAAQAPGSAASVGSDDPRDLVIAALKDALKSIARNAYGMQSILEEFGDDENAFNLRAHDYYRTGNSILRMAAHDALSDLEAITTNMTREAGE